MQIILGGSQRFWNTYNEIFWIGIVTFRLLKNTRIKSNDRKITLFSLGFLYQPFHTYVKPSHGPLKKFGGILKACPNSKCLKWLGISNVVHNLLLLRCYDQTNLGIDFIWNYFCGLLANGFLWNFYETLSVNKSMKHLAYESSVF